MFFDKETLFREVARTNPDHTMFIPTEEYEGDNVQLHVVEHPQFGGLMAFWTQSTYEGHGNNRLMMATSRDGGNSWTAPRFLLGCRPGYTEKQASWSFPVVSRSGRIYLFYFRETDYVDISRQLSAAFACIYSDDFGETWSESTDLPMRMTPYDACEIQNNCACQLPHRGPDGVYLFGYTKWTSYQIARPDCEQETDSHLYFARLENIDDDPEPRDLKITYLPEDENGVSLWGEINGKRRSSAQEPFWVNLPDGRLFCVMRTMEGYAYYTVSKDMGRTWREPQILRFADGSPVVHPLSPCFLSERSDGGYLMLYHGKIDPNYLFGGRDELFCSDGVFDPDAEQPIRFEAGLPFMKLPEEGKAVGQFGLAMYGSCTHQNGHDILWYPDRKFFLLGRDL